ncbi:MAG: penicillin-binding protein 2, partial [Spongiibacteraceae bacterium]|nr:penicillin-binding protein 2 [Spongiibacteraceae bacterium]
MPERLTLKDFSREVRLFGGRLLVAALFVAVGFGILAYRYYDLQVNHYETYRTASDRNRVQLQPIAPRRGLIYDRNGVLLAQNLPTYSLNLVVERVEDLEGTIEALSGLVAISDDDIAKFRRRARERRPFQPVPLRMRLSEVEIAQLAVHRPRLPGVSVDAELVRHYPQGEVFSHAIGYVGRINEQELERLDPVNYSDTHYIGKLGVERFYEDELHGTVGYQNVETNARGRILRVLERGDPIPGNDLVLHLDAHVQQVAYDALAGRRGVVVAIDVKSGGVLALVSTPGFDPNLFLT